MSQEDWDIFDLTMALAAAEDGHLELVQWLCGEGGFARDEYGRTMGAAILSW